jgi:3-hydroxybutyryl-CoA dehydrogenase
MLAAKGLDVMLVEHTTQKDWTHSYDMIETSLDKQLEKWAITKAEKKLILSRIPKGEHI